MSEYEFAHGVKRMKVIRIRRMKLIDIARSGEEDNFAEFGRFEDEDTGQEYEFFMSAIDTMSREVGIGGEGKVV